MGELKVSRGSQSGYDAMPQKDNDMLYFCVDTGVIYLGENKFPQTTDRVVIINGEYVGEGEEIDIIDATSQWFGSVSAYNALVDGGLIQNGVAYHIMLQPNWNENDTTSLAYIQNKPTIPTATSQLTNDSDFQTGSDVSTAISTAMKTAYKAAGSLTASGITQSLLVYKNEGNVYNITEEFTTTSNFVGGAGKTYPAGTNIVIVDVGSGKPPYKFDVIMGDISGKADKANGAVNGNFASLDSNGNLTDSGYDASDFLTSHQTLPEYTIVKLGTAEAGYASSYVLNKDNVQVGATINIPKDMVVESGEVKTVTTANVPYQGAVVGDKYIDLTIANSSSQHIYIPVKDLVDVYTAGNGIDINASNVVSVKVDSSNANGLSVGANGLSLSSVSPSTGGTGGSAGAMTAADKEKLDGIAAGAEANILEGVQVNGTDLTITGKKVNITTNSAYNESTNKIATIADIGTGQGYGTCSTNSTTSGATMVASLTGYELSANGLVAVKFDYTVPVNAKLDINSQGAKNIRYNGANITAGVIQADNIAQFFYDGTYYHLVGIIPNIVNGTGAGAVKTRSATLANGTSAFAEGTDTTAHGNYSHAEGSGTSARAIASHSEGANGLVIGNYSHIEGGGTVKTLSVTGAASATTYTTSSAHGLKIGDCVNYMTTYRYVTEIPSTTSFILNGYLSASALSGATVNVYTHFAYNESSHVEGIQNACIAKYGHAEGGVNSVMAQYGHAEGYMNIVYGSYGHTEGSSNIAYGNRGHSEGNHTYCIGESAHTEGSYTTTGGSYTHAEGVGARTAKSYTLSGDVQGTTYTTSAAHDLKVNDIIHVIGGSGCPRAIDSVRRVTAVPSTTSITLATKLAASTSPTGTFGGMSVIKVDGVSLGSASHSEGRYCNAVGAYSHVEGQGTRAYNSIEHAEGNYNLSTPSSAAAARTIHSIGIGSSDSNRKNALEVKYNGDMYLTGVGGYTGANYNGSGVKTLQAVLSELDNSNLVHKTGAETIAGFKTFTSSIGIGGSNGSLDFIPHNASEHEIEVAVTTADTTADVGVLLLNDIDESSDVIIRGVHAPTENNDAVNKQYVDNAIGGVTPDHVITLNRVHIGTLGLNTKTLCAFNNHEELVSLIVYDSKSGEYVPNVWDVFPIDHKIYYYDGANKSGNTDAYNVTLYTSHSNVDVRKMLYGSTDADKKAILGYTASGSTAYTRSGVLYAHVYADEYGWRLRTDSDNNFIVNFNNDIKAETGLYLRIGSHNASATTDTEWWSASLEDNNPIYEPVQDSYNINQMLEYRESQIQDIYKTIGDIETLLAAI